MAQHSGEMLHSSSHEAVTYIPAATARVVVTGLVLGKELRTFVVCVGEDLTTYASNG